ncbi:MAG: hypothetical protein ACPLZD_05170 [Candidatus Saccharicenans sp.]|nr:MAG: hypothetical protein C0168_03420 [Candidatus Aminicenantes bacterium]HEK86094.1 hypothetical protein [Candidatus Aminicenantes bacterium]
MPKLNSKKKFLKFLGTFLNEIFTFGGSLVLILMLSSGIRAQESKLTSGQSIEQLKKTAPKVFIDCSSCDLDYIKTEIPFVNYVRERKEADVHVLITTLSTGSGGREYTLTFIGQNRFEGQDDLLKFFSHKTDSQEEIRSGLTEVLKIGLLAYVNRTPISQKIKIDYEPQKAPTGPIIDKWKSWVFSLSTSGYFNGEQSHAYQSVRGSFSANKVTKDIKFNLSLSASYSHDRYTYEDLNLESGLHTYSGSGLLVKSVSEHWSAGFFYSAYSSTYSNYRLNLTLAPAVEFDLFPYSESTRRQLRFLYKIGPTYARYFEETLYDKTKETLLSESLAITLDLREKWGSISTSIQGSHYFHDFSKHNLSIFNTISLNLVKGLNAYVFGGASLVHDQLSLPKGGATWEEVLLQRKMLATSYNYFFAIGCSYSFGSIFTNVVNPRFGSVSSGGVQITIGD